MRDKAIYEALCLKVFAAVERRDAAAAVKLVERRTKRTRDYKGKGLMAGPFVADVEAVFTAHPKIIERIPEEAMIPLRSAAAMGFLVDGNFKRWLPSDFTVVQYGFSKEVAARMIVVFVQIQRTTTTWRKIGIVTTARIINSMDRWNPPCSACRSIAHTWRAGDQPELPHEFCENSAGCRCVLVGSAGPSSVAACGNSPL